MVSRIVPLLLFFSFINAQIALPTFQAVHKPHTAVAVAESDSQTFSYTGAQQTLTVPSGVSTITIKAWGARGGGGGSSYIGGVSSSETIAGNATMPDPDGGTMTGREGNGVIIISW